MDVRRGNLQAQVKVLTGQSNRKMFEEDAVIEERKFKESLMKAELRESRALCSSMRVKLKYYEEEVARLRYSIASVYTIKLRQKRCPPPRTALNDVSSILDGCLQILRHSRYSAARLCIHGAAYPRTA